MVTYLFRKSYVLTSILHHLITTPDHRSLATKQTVEKPNPVYEEQVGSCSSCH